jgi:MSHA pilin protein MshD
MRRVRGVTLIELVVSIAVISIAATALLGTLGYINGNSGGAMQQAQAQAIATAYLNEITAKSFADPDGADGEATRDLYDDVNDYDDLDDASARDRFGNVVGNFHVRVDVTGAALGGVPAANSLRVDVTVDYGGASQVMVSGFRMNY